MSLLQITLLLLLAVSFLTTLAQIPPTVFDYHQLPACALDCKILETSELNCIPPAAPCSNQWTYQDCVCQSDYLRSLHTSGAICHDVCSDEDDEVIYHYYNSLCGTLHPSHMPTSSMIPVPTTNPTTFVSPPAVTSTKDDEKDRQNNETWFDHNWKYFVAAVVVTATIFTVLFALTCYCRCRNRRNSDLEGPDTNPHSGLIPLQLLSSRSSQSLCQKGQSDWLKQCDTVGLDTGKIRSSSIMWPPATLPTSPSFAHSLGVYADEEQEHRRLKKVWPRSMVADILGMSLEDTEDLIRERLRTTGRPGIPLRARWRT
ncbi:hypothetical protein BKA66DRAFT_439500 [Pyrenochaeta sp. MPI-SDFR-AT-0127]|nr:hypothetical protein BKA66DRAFT_439500 [Pyrenochaeta sp. MPI-SDFR-AT-0127]